MKFVDLPFKYLFAASIDVFPSRLNALRSEPTWTDFQFATEYSISRGNKRTGKELMFMTNTGLVRLMQERCGGRIQLRRSAGTQLSRKKAGKQARTGSGT